MHTYVCVCFRMCVSTCVRVVSRTSLIFPRVRMRMRKWADGGKEKYVWVDLPGFCGSVVCVGCLPRVLINVIYGKYYL